MKSRSILCMTLSAVMMLSAAGCATTGEPLTAEQKMVRCGAMVAGGAILGGVIGNNTGDGDAGTGALVGALAGGGACGVWLAFQNEQDKRRLMEARLAALEQGQSVEESWTGTDGRVRSVVVSPSTDTQMIPTSQVESADKQVRVCRTLNTQASVSGTQDAINEVWCRTEAGNWEPAEEAMEAA